ncbi:hypothetical protein Tco_1429693 [Tanacetum coccineum]
MRKSKSEYAEKRNARAYKMRSKEKDEYSVWHNIPCAPDYKIVGQILIDHPLSYALTTTSDVLASYLQRFWKIVSKVPDTKDTIRFKLDRQEIVYTVDMFCSTLNLPVETTVNPFIAQATMKYIQPFMQIIGYQGDVDKVSAFFTNNLAQPWNTIVHVDYAAFLCWDFLHYVQQKKDQIQYPRFTKLIIADFMNKFSSIPQRLEEDYLSIKDAIPLECKEYMKVFVDVDAPIIQPDTPIPPPSDNRERDEESYVSEFVDSVFHDDDDSGNRIEPGSHNEHPEIVDDDDENKKEKKDNDKDDDVNDDYIDHTLDKTQEMGSLETRNEQTRTPILSPHRSPRTILSSDKTISKELTDNESPLTSTRSQGQSKTRRISSKYTHIPQALRRICMRQDIMIKKMEKKFVTNHDFQAIHKNVDNVLHDVIPKIASNATNDIFEDNLPKNNVSTIHPTTSSSTATPSSADLQHQLYLKMKRRGEKSKKAKESKILKSARGSSSKQPVQRFETYVSKRQQQQQEWDTWVEELNGNLVEKSYILLLHKIHVVPFLEDDLEEKMNRWVQKEFNTFNEEARLPIQHSKDSWNKRLYKINHRRVRANPEEYFSNHKIVEVVRVTTKQQYGLDCLEQIIVIRENDKPDNFFEADFKYLNKNDIEDLYNHAKTRKLTIVRTSC